MLAVVTLKRTYKTDRTEGIVTLPNGEQIFTLERPWLNNKPNVSCIPPGVYECAWMERSASGRYRRCWHVLGVEGRSGILWHAGNLVRHTLGCILTGLKFGILEKTPAILSSKNALNRMRDVIGPSNFLLVVM